MENRINIFNENCIIGAKIHLKDESVDLGIYDPPFGIQETKFDNIYGRNKDGIIDGYEEAPLDYDKFSKDWIGEAKRILKPNGSMYIISGWTHLNKIMNAIEFHNLYTINHLVWRFNYGVFTKRKFVSSHYHILYLKKNKKENVTFNTYCRFSPTEKDISGNSRLYEDLEDVFCIKKEYSQNEEKNQNKLPDELIKKLVLYSSNKEDVVVDFFMGNFTTAKVSLGLGRNVCGFELNKNAFDYWMKKLYLIEFGKSLNTLKEVKVELPKNQGKPISDDERKLITEDFIKKVKFEKYTKKSAIEFLMAKYGRGKFSITNIVEDIDMKSTPKLVEKKSEHFS